MLLFGENQIYPGPPKARQARQDRQNITPQIITKKTKELDELLDSLLKQISARENLKIKNRAETLHDSLISIRSLMENQSSASIIKNSLNDLYNKLEPITLWVDDLTCQIDQSTYDKASLIYAGANSMLGALTFAIASFILADQDPDINNEDDARGTIAGAGAVIGFTITTLWQYVNYRRHMNQITKVKINIEKMLEEAFQDLDKWLSSVRNMMFWNHDAFPLGHWNLLGHDNGYVCRDSLENEIKNHFSDSTQPARKIIVLQGISGSGKKSTANHIARKVLKGNYDFCCRFDANSIKALQLSYRDFADNAGIKTGPTKNEGNVIDDVRRYLQTVPRCLIIYESAQRYSDLEKFLPDTDAHIIITTRHKHTGWDQGKVIISDEPDQNLIRLIVKNNSTNQSESYIDNLTKKLNDAFGTHAMISRQAAVYLNVHKTVTVEEYIRLCNENLIKPEEGGCGHSNDEFKFLSVIATNMRDITDHFFDKPQETIVFLWCLGYLKHQRIPLEFLLDVMLQYSDKEKTSIKIWLEKLEAFFSNTALAQIDSESRTMYLPMLVRDYIRHKWSLTSLGHDIITNGFVRSVLREINPTHDQKAKAKILLPHAEFFLLDQVELYSGINSAPSRIKSNLRLLSVLIGKFYLYPLGDPQKAIEYLKIAREIEDHPNKNKVTEEEKDNRANTSIQLANAYLFIGRLESAMQEYNHALKIKEDVYGPDSYEAARVLVNRGSLFRIMGKLEQAAEDINRNLEVYEPYFSRNKESAEYYRLGISRFNIACVYHEQGENSEAIKNFIKALDIFAEVRSKDNAKFNKDNFWIPWTTTLLGAAYCSDDQLQNAEEKLTDALKTYQSSEHYDDTYWRKGLTLQYLGILYQKLDRFAQGFCLLCQGFKIIDDYFGNEHYETKAIFKDIVDFFGVNYANEEHKRFKYFLKDIAEACNHKEKDNLPEAIKCIEKVRQSFGIFAKDHWQEKALLLAEKYIDETPSKRLNVKSHSI